MGSDEHELPTILHPPRMDVTNTFFKGAKRLPPLPPMYYREKCSYKPDLAVTDGVPQTGWVRQIP